MPIFTSNRVHQGMMKTKPQQPLIPGSVAGNIYSSHLMGATSNLGTTASGDIHISGCWGTHLPKSPVGHQQEQQSASHPKSNLCTHCKIKPIAQLPTSLRSCSKISKTCSYSMSFLLYIKRAHYIYLLLFVAVTNA